MSQILKIGSLLDHGKYRVEKVLGQGGFGITYLVTDLGLDKLRAVKEFFPKDYCERNETTSQVSLGTTNTAEFVKRLKAKFIKEARNIANLDQHHGIIKIHTVFEENNTAYYVMDYIEGESLSAMVKRSGPVPVDRAVKYITEVGEALEYVHKHRINHLDVKPANIMIRKKDDKPILIDFGLAKQYDSEGLQTSTTPTGISHGFAPFEQYRDGGVKEFSPQTDVYSLAATLFYIVSGQIPPHATDLIENELTFPAEFPEALKAPIRKAMSSKRQSRPESVSKFIESLNQNKKKVSQNDDTDDTVILNYINETGKVQIKNSDKSVVSVDSKISQPKKRNFQILYLIIGCIMLCGIIFLIFIAVTNNSRNLDNQEIGDNFPINSTEQVMNNMLTRTSIRQFLDKPIPKDTLDVILKAGMTAPSAGNVQPWEFIVISDKSKLERLNELQPYSNLKSAPMAIVVCGNMEKEKILPEGNEYWVQDCSAASENILLASHAYGLGAVWTGVFPIKEKINNIKKELDLPNHIIPLNIIALGFPAENPVPKDKFNQKDIHYQRY